MEKILFGKSFPSFKDIGCVILAFKRHLSFCCNFLGMLCLCLLGLVVVLALGKKERRKNESNGMYFVHLFCFLASLINLVDPFLIFSPNPRLLKMSIWYWRQVLSVKLSFEFQSTRITSDFLCHHFGGQRWN